MLSHHKITFVVAAVSLVSGCSYLPGHSTPTTPPSSATRSSIPQSPSASAAPTFTPVPGDDGPQSAPSTPPVATARYTAEAFARAWARPDLPPTEWLAGVKPYATPGYGQLLASVDPARIPAHKITGPPTPTSSTTVINTFDVPTDAGTLHITCQLLDDQWLVTAVDLERTP